MVFGYKTSELYLDKLFVGPKCAELCNSKPGPGILIMSAAPQICTQL